MRCGFVDDDNDPVDRWVAVVGVVADRACPVCAGTGQDQSALPCGCLVAAVLDALPAAAERAQAVPGCARCDGDGEDLDGVLCPCLLMSVRAAVLADPDLW